MLEIGDTVKIVYDDSRDRFGISAEYLEENTGKDFEVVRKDKGKDFEPTCYRLSNGCFWWPEWLLEKVD